jgi:cytochrome c
MKREVPIPALLVALGVLLTAVVAFSLVDRGRQHPAPPVWPVPDGDPARGRAAIMSYGCGACHQIEGIRSAQGRVGPKLIGFSHQVYVAGVVPNTPENLIHWIQHPQDVNPLTAMPDLRVTEQDARDIAAYLYTLR